MFLSVFDVFKVGIGPSSSHTVGPMVAARRFVAEEVAPREGRVRRVAVALHGSLAYTGRGHGTDRAIALGLLGERPDEVDPDRVDGILAALAADRTLAVAGYPEVAFDPTADLAFLRGPSLSGHPNGMTFSAFDDAGERVVERIFYSIGGGFVLTAEELDAGQSGAGAAPAVEPDVPYPFATARTMLAMGAASGLSIATMKRANEAFRAPGHDLDAGLDRLWAAMAGSIDRGLGEGGTLPGGLRVRRRARDIYRQLKAEDGANSLQPHRVMDWLGVYAMAVN